MLISYVLLIFALTSSVVAPRPGLQLDSWKLLRGNTDQRLLKKTGPNNCVYRWYRLKRVNKPKDVPSWPQDKNLDQVMQFTPTNDGIDVAYLHLRRDPDLRLLQRPTNYFSLTKGPALERKIIRLVGFWGRASKLNVSDNFWKLSIVVPHAQVYSISLRIMGLAR